MSARGSHRRACREASGRGGGAPIALAIAALAVALAPAFVGPRSAQGARKDRIRSVHAPHAASDVTCDVCHAAAATSRAGTDDLLPKEEVCAECHDVKDASACGTCHVEPAAPLSSPRITNVAAKFPHETHLAQGLACADCHGPAEEGAEPALPDKGTCRACHATASALSDCAVCHAESETVRPASHTPGWSSLHGVEARVARAACENCHTQTDCQECHGGDDVRPRVHRLNFGFDHALEARGNELACATCHEDRSWCAACHAAERILPSDHSRAGWVLADGGHHAEEARFDLESCVACHDAGADAPTCARCHGR